MAKRSRPPIPPPRRAPAPRAQLPLTLAAVAQAQKYGRLADLRALADRAHEQNLPDIALAALEALLALGEQGRTVRLKKAQILRQYGRAQEAVPILQAFLAEQGDDLLALELLANTYVALRRDDLALPYWRRLTELLPDRWTAWFALAQSLEQTGARAEAEAALDQALALDPHCGQAMALKPRLAFERCPADAAAQEAGIARAIDACRHVIAWSQTHPERLAEARQLVTFGPFAAAYWPGELTPLLQAWHDYNAALWGAGSEALPPPDATRSKIRLGLFTRQLYHQSVFYILLRGLIRLLDRQFFELVLFANVAQPDALTEWCKTQADRFYARRPAWQATIAQEACDVLYYPDLTADPESVALAKARLAPLQVTSWGHPVSSAIPALDLFFSGELIDAPDAPRHYTERLVRLPGTGAATPNIALGEAPLPEALAALLSAAAARRRFVALVPVYSFKLAPADDELWLTLARRHPELVLLFFYQAELGHLGQCNLLRLRQRMLEAGLSFAALGEQAPWPASGALEAAASHAVAVPHLPFEQFHSLLRQAALYLDVPSFSGYTTAWQGAFAGIPIVTLEGPFLRQRLASGLLRQIGLTDTIAQDRGQYLEIVGQLLAELRSDPAAHAARRARMQAAAPRACNDERPVRAMERALLEELARRDHPVAQRLLEAHRAKYPGYDYRRDEHRVVAPPPPWAASSAKLSPVGTASAAESTPAQRQDPPINATAPFAPQSVLGLGATSAPSASSAPTAPAASPNPAAAPAAPLPPWKLLEADLHLATLSHTYAPVGLLEMIPTAPGAVFDLGCFVGGTGRWLKQKFPAVRLVGVELLEKAAEKARAVYDEVFTGRFEDFDVEARRGEFDVLIAADVLEHLYNPWAALERLKTLLAPGGSLYVSLPNIRNLRVLEALAAAGEWRYEGAGILDVTHIRFFTRQSALRMFAETGWQVLETRANLDAALKPMIEGKNLSEVRNIELPKLVLRNLQGQESVEVFTLQWFFRCQPI